MEAIPEKMRLASAMLAVTLLLVSTQGAAQERTAAVWKWRELGFFYGSSTAIYSCGALQRRVASILRAIGARGDLEVKVDHCRELITVPDAGMNDAGSRWEAPSDGFPDRASDQRQAAHVRIGILLPAEATPEVLAEIERDKSRRELVERVGGKASSKLTDPNVFTAQWQRVTLSRKTVGLEPVECELLDQMSRGLLQDLGVRVVRRGYVCGPGRVSNISPELEVEVLLPALFVTGEAQQRPPPVEDETNTGRAANGG